eukprot:CAMPEP_0174743006 /NCGR_PEP_ID=MMETSP1094-20130205/80514_1 /TAXON_ID=156173 /ORGANISM="Chrysochromulina brevifilum, Strain UTEX LB 985" /LENGTH=93 /DNA_ID=CAMNT_0015947151 /DNA_START=660 /DNA_END=937 /DNA_ORIENTATION=-
MTSVRVFNGSLQGVGAQQQPLQLDHLTGRIAPFRIWHERSIVRRTDDGSSVVDGLRAPQAEAQTCRTWNAEVIAQCDVGLTIDVCWNDATIGG